MTTRAPSGLFPPPRIALLAAALLTACAAGDAKQPAQDALAIPPGVLGNYLAGRFAVAETDTGVAADRLLAAERADPDQPELLQQAFLAAVLDGRPDAVRLARRLPDNPVATLVLAGDDGLAGSWERAENRARTLPHQGVLPVLTPVLVAWSQQGRGQVDRALATLDPLVMSGQLRALYALHAALIADLADRHDDAERYIRVALEEQQPTLRLAQAAAGILARAGKRAEGQQLLNRLAANGDDMSLAVTGAGGRAVLDGRIVNNAAEGIAEGELALAAALRAQGAPEFSILLSRLALRLRPHFTAALLLASDADADRRHDQNALALLDQVPPDDPLAPVVALRRAALLDRLDRVDEAAGLLQHVAAEHPDSVVPVSRLGDLYRAHSRWPEAVKVYDDAIGKLRQPRANDWPLFYARGIALERAGQWPRAEADLKHALELAPDQPYLLNYLGYTWVEKNRNLPEARRMLERAVELRPQDGNIADSLGWALFRMGDVPGALGWLEKGVQLEPRNATINDHLGDVYWAAGRRAEAEFQWRRALIFDPDPGEAPKIEAKLRDGLPAAASR